jgi:16S rRNA (guanine527-N7)-methyltransferase
MPEAIFRYFPSLSDTQKEKILRLKPIYDRWNSMINVISRKDIDNFFVHHVLHSLSIGKVITFKKGTRILDVGTGGGFPGIPLAILFPEAEFFLLDSVGKKIKVVSAVADELELKNITTIRKRIEEEDGMYDFVVSRAVTEFKRFTDLTVRNISRHGINSLKNGIICLKGGDLDVELATCRNRLSVWEIKEFFAEPFFETKKIVYLPL